MSTLICPKTGHPCLSSGCTADSRKVCDTWTSPNQFQKVDVGRIFVVHDRGMDGQGIFMVVSADEAQDKVEIAAMMPEKQVQGSRIVNTVRFQWIVARSYKDVFSDFTHGKYYYPVTEHWVDAYRVQAQAIVGAAVGGYEVPSVSEAPDSAVATADSGGDMRPKKSEIDVAVAAAYPHLMPVAKSENGIPRMMRGCYVMEAMRPDDVEDGEPLPEPILSRVAGLPNPEWGYKFEVEPLEGRHCGVDLWAVDFTLVLDIPLTREWLLRLGFDAPDKRQLLYVLGDFSVEFCAMRPVLYVDYLGSQMEFPMGDMSVSKLQCIYFLHTGTMLGIVPGAADRRDLVGELPLPFDANSEVTHDLLLKVGFDFNREGYYVLLEEGISMFVELKKARKLKDISTLKAQVFFEGRRQVAASAEVPTPIQWHEFRQLYRMLTKKDFIQ